MKLYRKSRQKLWLGVSGFCLAWVLGFPAQAGVYDDEAEATFYRTLSNAFVSTVYDLEALFAGSQQLYIEYPPPDGRSFNQFGEPFVVPVDWNGFPDEFVSGLQEEFVAGVAVYDVKIMEKRDAGQVVFCNSVGTQIYALDLPEGYNPYAFLKEKYPDFEEFSASKQSRLLKRYHPARVEIQMRLVSEDAFSQYLYNQAQISQAKADRVAMGSARARGYFTRSSGSTGLLEITGMVPYTNEMELTIAYPSEDQNEVVEVFTYDPGSPDDAINPITNIWSLADTNVVLTGATQVTWLDDAITANTSNRYYTVGKTWIDEDGDELTDGREILIHKTDPENSDSDHDIMADKWELEYGFDPRPVEGELIAWWPLNETSGTNVSDASGNGHDGYFIYSPSDASWDDGLISNGLTFVTGGTAIVEFGIDSSIDPTGEEVTVSFWFKPATHEQNSSQYFMGKPPWVDGFRMLSYYSNSPIFSLKVNGTNRLAADYSYSTRMTAEKWNHVVGSYDGSAVRVYLDGVEVLSTNATGPISTPSLFFRFGHGSSNLDPDGTYDDVRLYQNALTSNEIYRLAQGGMDPDNDGYSNIEEYEAGTDPLTSNRYPSLTITYPVDGSVLP